MFQDAKLTERDAQKLLDEQKFEEAAAVYYRLTKDHQGAGQHHPAAMCLASAASCWARKAGESSFYQAARDYESAAREALLSKEFEYAGMLYKHAAVCYERDKEYLEFSECYFRSKECFRRFNQQSFFTIHTLREPRLWFDRETYRQFSEWFILSFSSMLWGYGERPHRTVIFGMTLMVLFAVLYMQGSLIDHGAAVKPSFGDALYFSVATFTTSAYGDITPSGANRFIAVGEAYSGLFIVSIFITGLCRKYLRE